MAVKTKKDKTKAFVAASFAGLLALSGVVIGAGNAHAEGGHCYGVNKCSGTGACGGKGHSCAGKNACKGQGFLAIDDETCLKIQGGSLGTVAE